MTLAAVAQQNSPRYRILSGSIAGMHLFGLQALLTNSTLEELDLGAAGIGNEGSRALAEGIKQSCSLSRLRLWNNSIGDAVCDRQKNPFFLL